MLWLPGREPHRAGGEVREAAAHRWARGDGARSTHMPTTAAVAAAGLYEPGAGHERQCEQCSYRLFHVSLLAETSDEKV